MNCLDSNAGEPTKAAAFEEDDAPIGVPALLYEVQMRLMSFSGGKTRPRRRQEAKRDTSYQDDKKPT
ncbi:hypothetical protein CDL15_Pgr009970 [Punica granatum]|uniref:Uncharacterized protein n=1 Tax=Punica granatum TaxID=22663 RepID=A0A218XPH4_PUNGR|nr:hypothetical protein CDL15_Pgr009970 [Punica granatum]